MIEGIVFIVFLEIGSEFHSEKKGFGQGLRFPIQGELVFSGRTAIEVVLKEIPKAKRALLPSYCCDSMIQPFRNAGIEVEFYPVYYDNGLIIEAKDPKKVDIFLWCDYFGFGVPMPDLSEFSGVIIEDITHSFFSTHAYHAQSDFFVASLRKWEPINCGGYCASISGNLNHSPVAYPPQGFIEKKTNAMSLKKEYLSDLDIKKKSLFLSMFRESNHWLADNYSGLLIDNWSRDYLSAVDMEKQRAIRIRNAKFLYRELRGAQFLFNEEDMDCPLFVPILLQNRDEVKRILTENLIYCPVHWPKPEGVESNLYGIELSIICDQRYNESDMERIVSVLNPLL